MKVKIIIDSTANITDNVRSKCVVVPLSVHFGAEEFIDGVTISNDKFYEKLKNCKELPTTSQPTPQAFMDVFNRETADGSALVVLTISSKLSGTYQSANIAAAEFDNVFIVDTKSVAIGAGILAEMAVKLAEDGISAQEIAAVLKRERENIRLVALLDTLEYLKKGGRISKAVALAGGLLSIKPVLCLEDGEIRMLGKARGSKQGNNLLVEEIEKYGGVDFSKPLLLGYSGNDDSLLKTYIDDSENLWKGNVSDLSISTIGSVVGTHVGPGAIAVAFFKNV